MEREWFWWAELVIPSSLMRCCGKCERPLLVLLLQTMEEGAFWWTKFIIPSELGRGGCGEGPLFVMLFKSVEGARLGGSQLVIPTHRFWGGSFSKRPLLVVLF